jgi:hypothetical protein
MLSLSFSRPASIRVNDRSATMFFLLAGNNSSGAIGCSSQRNPDAEALCVLAKEMGAGAPRHLPVRRSSSSIGFRAMFGSRPVAHPIPAASAGQRLKSS